MAQTMTESKLFLLAGGLASLGGLAAKLKAGQTVTVTEIARAIVVSLTAGLTMALWTYPVIKQMPQYEMPWLGLCLLAGYGGAGIMDFAVELLKRRMAKETQVTENKEHPNDQ